ncbi:MAG: dihydropteridine reductase [Firmicutes bacterium]|nr:dihydropteridine reductase [Bacillota bacterium]
MKNTEKVYAEQIAAEYSPKTTSKAVALRKLDNKVKKAPKIASITFGTVATLIFGTGMCLGMKVIGAGTAAAMAAGIAIGVAGMALMAVNYPLYKKFLNARKKKYAFEIVELARQITDEAAEE